MQKSIYRALLILALLVPLSRLSFADDTFAVSGTISDSGDVESGEIGIPYLTSNGVLGGWEGGSGVTWGAFNNLWTIGSVEGTVISLQGFSGASWTFEGISGGESYGTFDVSAGGCIVEESGCAGAQGTWSGDLYLEDDSGTTLFEIQMSGTATASFGGTYFSNLDALDLISGTADVTGGGQVVYEAPCVPEPSTLTLMMIAGIASILAKRFRRTCAAQN